MPQSASFDSRSERAAALKSAAEGFVRPRSLLRLGSASAEKQGLAHAAENAGYMGHWHVDLLTHVVTWSPETYRIFGVTPDAFAPNWQSIVNLTHAEDRALFEKKFREVIETGRTPYEFDFRVTRPDGAHRNVISSGQTEVDNLGRAVALFGVITDVTEAFDTIRSIQDQNEMLDLAAQLAQLGHRVWSRDADRLRFCSEEMPHLHEMRPDAFLRRFTHPNLLAAAVALAGARPYEIEYCLQTSSVALRNIHEIGQPILDRDGKLTRFIATVQDVTISKRRENALEKAQSELVRHAEELRKSEAKLREIIEGSLQGSIVIRGFKPVLANQAFARIMGVKSPQELLDLDDIRTPMRPDRAKYVTDLWQDVMETGQAIAPRLVQGCAFDGRAIWTESTARRIDWEGEPALLINVIDVTDRLCAEEELKKKTRELESINFQKDKLFSIIAHDLRNPFNSIIGFADRLVTNARNLSHGKTVSYAQIVREAATGVHNLLDNLLAWASFQMRDSSLNFSTLDLAAVAAASLEPLTYMAEAKRVTIANGIGPDSVNGDEALVRILIRNLVSNTIKFLRNGGVIQLTASRLPHGQGCAVDAAIQVPMIRVTVRDDGIGMSATAISTLFTLERTVSTPGTRGEKGPGLGLYLCRDIVARHSGVITVESSPSTGTAFHFTLPAAP